MKGSAVGSLRQYSMGGARRNPSMDVDGYDKFLRSPLLILQLQRVQRVSGIGIDNMIDPLIAINDELPALPAKGGCYFFTAALAERRSRLLTENIQGLPTHEVSNHATI